jgi:hypothetical protein
MEKDGNKIVVPVMRMLIPKRGSGQDKENEKAYLLELVINQEIELSVMHEYEV